MRLSEYIKKLQQIAAEHGPDLCVLATNTDIFLNPIYVAPDPPCVNVFLDCWLQYTSPAVVKEFNLRAGDKVLWV